MKKILILLFLLFFISFVPKSYADSDEEVITYEGVVMQDVDEKIKINEIISKDKSSYYAGKSKFDFLDYDSVEVLSEDFIKDKNEVCYVTCRQGYCGCGLIKNEENIDVETFEVYEKSIYPLARDKNHIYAIDDCSMWECSIDAVEIIDKDSFEMLNATYGKDKNKVFYYDLHIYKVGAADPGTFTVINRKYGKDENNYFRGSEIITDPQEIAKAEVVDLESLKNLGNFEADDNNVYCGNKLIEGSDVESFTVLENCRWFGKDKNMVYYCNDSTVTKISDADVESFSKLMDHGDSICLAADKNDIYYYDRSVGTPFGKLSVDMPTLEILEGDYLRDKNNLYYDYKIVDNIDLDSFEVVGYGVVKDKNSVYVRKSSEDNEKIEVHSKVKTVQPDSFRNLYYYYYADDQSAFFIKKTVFGLKEIHKVTDDVENFRVLSSVYAKDANNYYKNGKIIDNDIDLKEAKRLEGEISENVISGEYTATKANVFLRGIIIDGAHYDPHSDIFKIMKFPYLKDYNGVYYYWDQISGADPDTFNILNSDYSKDKFNIYYKNNIIEEADVDTFKLIDREDYQAEDKNYYYNKGEIAEPKGTEPDSGSDNDQGNDNKLRNKLQGKIVLRVEENGEAYYINPENQSMHSLGRPQDAFSVMRGQGVGITNIDLRKIPMGLSNLTGPDSDQDGLPDLFEDAIGTDKENPDTDNDGHNDKQELESQYNPNGEGKLNTNQNFAQNQKGKILLQVEGNGEAWYVNPEDNKRYFLGRPTDAFQVMRRLGLGISNRDFKELE